MKNPWVVIGIIAVLLIGGAVWYSSVAAKSYNEGVVIAPHVTGNADSPVKLIEYSDFQCPACGQFEPVVQEILKNYGDKLSFEYRNFPLAQIHPFAEPAARAAEAAGQQGKFFEFHDLLFKNQETWVGSGNPSAYFLQYAKDLGLDIDQFTRHQRSSVIRNHISTQFNEARDLGFTGTPSFMLNGQKMNITSYDDFKQQIAAAIDPALIITPQSIDNATGTDTVVTPVPATNIKFGM